MSSVVPGDAKRTLANIVQGAVDKVKDLLDGDEHEPLPTVGSVDPARYAGLWYELARLPMRFQADVTVSTAEYTLRDDGVIAVRNTAHRGDEVDAVIEGEATPADGAEETFDRLKVRFGGILKLVPIADEGNYWILALADDYGVALVGTPDRRSLWLLARSTDAWDRPEPGAYLQQAADLGYSLDHMLLADWERRVTDAADR